MLRGKPTHKASFHDNVVVHNDAGKAVRLKDAGCPTNACNLDIGPNLYNTDTSSELAVGDFDGDGRDDLFLANGTGWWYSSAGVTEWQFLRRSPLRIKDLRFGRFDSDAKTDVLFIERGWYVWSAGQIAAKLVRGGGPRLTDCVFGDFDGDGITDALWANGTTWSVAPAAQGPWIPKHNSRVAAVNLRTFKGAGHDQIFWIDDAKSLWDPVSDSVTRDHRNPLRTVISRRWWSLTSMEMERPTWPRQRATGGAGSVVERTLGRPSGARAVRISTRTSAKSYSGASPQAIVS